MTKEKFKQYADLMVEKRAIEEKLEELKPGLKAEIEEAGGDKVDTDFGTFTLGRRTTWKYSEAVTKLQEEEKARGVAQAIETVSLTYKALKEKINVE